jgi:hypothetical protein
MTTPLSPAAEAVMDAAFPVYDDEHLYVATGEQHAGMIAAAALCAAAYQVKPIEYEVIDNLQYEVRSPVSDALLAIAAELEGR